MKELKVFLSKAHIGDARELFNALEKGSISNFSFFETPVTYKREQAYLRKIKKEGSYLFLIKDKSAKIIGTCGLHEVDRENQTARIGLTIFSKEQRHKGYGKVAMTELIRISFDELRLEKLYANVIATNVDQITWDMEFGFQTEGYLKAEYLLRGQRHDMIRLALLKQKWQKFKA